ncbi:MAG TPA: cation:proton antiporter [Methylocella sp.]|jgi:Kef-type K+ transport system membrane component KefB
MKKYVLLYSAVIIIFGLGIYFTLAYGQHLAPPAGTSAIQTGLLDKSSPAPAVNSSSILSGIKGNLQEPLGRLILQLIVIVVAARLMGRLVGRIGQPAVVGEMIAGILLGPSLFGSLYPEVFNFVFPSSSLGPLKLISQIGVCLFMFIVGLEVNVGHLRHKAQTAVVVSHASIVIPYFLGVTASLLFYAPLAGPGIPFMPFALFLGISMSITAFPVLARILMDRRIEDTPLGTTSIACAAVDDATAWTILAFVVAIAKSTTVASSVLSLTLVVAFVLFMIFVIRPQLPRWFGVQTSSVKLTDGTLPAVLIFSFTSALATEIIGIHALFGAFLAGAIMPTEAKFREFLTIRLENFSSTFLVPLFFAFTGLRTQIGLLDDAESWMYCAALIFIATLGKLGSSMLAARFTGLNWIDSFSLGALMNTRGLMELIAINIGYDLGILSPRIFAMLVIMALFTTFMTGPLLSLADLARNRFAPATATR